MSDTPKALTTLTALFHSQTLGVLSTQRDGRPYASLVAFSFDPDLSRLYFLTARHTRKYQNLMACDQVAVLIHSAGNRADDFKEAISATALGRAIPLADKALALRAFLDRHPDLAEFARDPDTAMVAVVPETYILVSRFQQVEEISMKPWTSPQAEP